MGHWRKLSERVCRTAADKLLKAALFHSLHCSQDGSQVTELSTESYSKRPSPSRSHTMWAFVHTEEHYGYRPLWLPIKGTV